MHHKYSKHFINISMYTKTSISLLQKENQTSKAIIFKQIFFRLYFVNSKDKQLRRLCVFSFSAIMLISIFTNYYFITKIL